MRNFFVPQSTQTERMAGRRLVTKAAGPAQPETLSQG